MSTHGLLAYETLKENWGEYELDGENVLVLGRTSLVAVRVTPEESKGKRNNIRMTHSFVTLDLEKLESPIPPDAHQDAARPPQVKGTFHPGKNLKVHNEQEGIYRLIDGTILVLRMRIQEIRLLDKRNENGEHLIQVDHITDIIAAPQLLSELPLGSPDEKTTTTP